MKIKLRAGNYMIPAELIYTDDRIFVKFRYNRRLIAEIKAMEGARWHGFEEPPRKIWSIADSERNAFQLAYLRGQNPYAPFDSEIISREYGRPLYVHQGDFSDFMLARHYCIIAGEMGLGKTLSAIEVMEHSGFDDWWYAAPKSGLREVERQFRFWEAKIIPQMFTYERLTKTMKEWPKGKKAPRGLFLDESARVKNPTAQRSQAAMTLATGIRNDWGDDGFVVLMSGAPAPKSPADWWHQCEIACPGYIKEGSQMKFKKRLAVIVERASITGGVYPHLESWLDDESKCSVCGLYQDNEIHLDRKSLSATELNDEYHRFEPSINEVAYLYKRMKGLVMVKFKKDCLDLPEKRYHIVELKPSQPIINLAKTIISTSSTVIAGITLLRELSDGFQYQNIEDGVGVCSVCNGEGWIVDPLDETEVKRIDCDGCGGSGTKKKYKRIAKQLKCPKEDALIDLLDEHLEVGRMVIYAGFTGSVDRCVDICQKCGWETIRVDGRGWVTSMEGDPLDIFQDELDKHPRVAFIGQPGAAGMGLTLTASPTIVYYSNDFNFEHRIQSEDRIHRIGMDLNRGATIIDLIHLETDRLILANLQKKRNLQALTLGDLSSILGGNDVSVCKD